MSQTKYNVVRLVGKRELKMRLTTHDCPDEGRECDIYWQDSGQTAIDRLYKMKPYQRINHFPGMYTLARKDHLARNLTRMAK